MIYYSGDAVGFDVERIKEPLADLGRCLRSLLGRRRAGPRRRIRSAARPGSKKCRAGVAARFGGGAGQAEQRHAQRGDEPYSWVLKL